LRRAAASLSPQFGGCSHPVHPTSPNSTPEWPRKRSLRFWLESFFRSPRFTPPLWPSCNLFVAHRSLPVGSISCCLLPRGSECGRLLHAQLASFYLLAGPAILFHNLMANKTNLLFRKFAVFPPYFRPQTLLGCSAKFLSAGAFKAYSYRLAALHFLPQLPCRCFRVL